jgi:hypothetical protein
VVRFFALTLLLAPPQKHAVTGVQGDSFPAIFAEFVYLLDGVDWVLGSGPSSKPIRCAASLRPQLRSQARIVGQKAA